jgi:hypothetical protein
MCSQQAATRKLPSACFYRAFSGASLDFDLAERPANRSALPRSRLLGTIFGRTSLAKRIHEVLRLAIKRLLPQVVFLIFCAFCALLRLFLFGYRSFGGALFAKRGDRVYSDSA